MEEKLKFSWGSINNQNQKLNVNCFYRCGLLLIIIFKISKIMGVNIFFDVIEYLMSNYHQSY